MTIRTCYRFFILSGVSAFSIFLFSGCASHPTISSKTLQKGEKIVGYSFSFENPFPVLFYRYGLSERSDLGLRLGIPIYGTGLDYSRVLYEKEGKRDVLNIGWSLTPNSNFDFTYYKLKERKKRAGTTTYWGLRSMVIPNGISKRQSIRFGILLGSFLGERFSYEIGYFHDYASMPLSKIFQTNPKLDARFDDFPRTTEFGWPSEHSRATGLSIKFSFLKKPTVVQTQQY